jgi:hypothetical protein
MAIGTNIKFNGQTPALWAKFLEFLGNKGNAQRRTQVPRICYKAGVPNSANGAVDSPGSTDMIGLICIDLTNSDVYVCTAYTNDTTYTWTKITP